MLKDEPGSNPEWDRLLSAHLKRVAAPDELWRRIQCATPTHAARLSPGFRLLIAAAALSMGLVAWGVYALRQVNAANTPVAAMLASAPANLEFRSDQPAKIRRWVSTSTGIDIPLGAKPSAAVQLVGAHIEPGPTPTAAVVYRVRNENAVLLVTKANPKLPQSAGHAAVSGNQEKGLRVSSWTMHGQSYTVATVSENFRAACGICHTDTETLTAIN